MLTNGLALIDRARGALDVLVREMLKFGVIGAVAFVIDIGGYNLLVFGPHLLGMFGQQTTQGWLNDKPLTARIIAATVSTLVAWVGNRLWTFRHRRNRQVSHELALYLLFNVVAMVIMVVCLGISRYGFGLHTQLADNVTNIFGIVLGTLFRFWSYRKWVFAGDEDLSGPAEHRNTPGHVDLEHAGRNSAELDHRTPLDHAAGLGSAGLEPAEVDHSAGLDRPAELDRPANQG